LRSASSKNQPVESGSRQVDNCDKQNRDPNVTDDDQHDIDKEKLAPIDEDYFEDLPTLRAFLVNSSAFQIFREELAKFVLPKQLRPDTLHPNEFVEETATIGTTVRKRWDL
jgi:hypothetical protein